MTFFPKVSVREADTPDIDAFGSKRVSSQHILLSGQLVHADNLLVWDSSTANGGGGAYQVNKSAYQLTVDGTDGSESIRQSKRYWLYRAGQSQLYRATSAELTPQADVERRFGYFDAEDGVFFDVNGIVDVGITVRSFTTGSPVDTRAAQEDWNIDRLDPSLGLNPSGVTLDLTKSQHFVTDLQWLGVGRVRAGFDLGGRIVWCHEFDFSNIISAGPYMRRASLPVRYELRNTAAGAAATMLQSCSSVSREGGDEEEGIPLAVRTDISGVGLRTATSTKRNALAVRLRSSHIRAFLKPIAVSLANLGTGAVGWELLLNPAFTVALSTFASDGLATEFSIEQNEYDPGTAVGHRFAAGTVTSTNQNKGGERIDLESALGIAASIAGISDILALVVESAGAGPENVVANLSVRELF